MDLKKRRGHITAELREMAIRMLRNREVTRERLAEELGVHPSTLQRWVRASKQVENNEPLSPAERVELEELRRETKRLREQNEILKKFRAFVAKRER